MQTRVLAASGILALSTIGIALPNASAHEAGMCGPAHTYIDAKSATVTSKAVVIKGRHSRLRCGGPDDSSYVDGRAETLRMILTGKVKVWKVPEDPSQGTRTIVATKLPRWLKRNRSEPVYKVTGPRDSVSKLVEEWHP